MQWINVNPWRDVLLTLNNCSSKDRYSARVIWDKERWTYILVGPFRYVVESGIPSMQTTTALYHRQSCDCQVVAYIHFYQDITRLALQPVSDVPVLHNL